MDSVVRKYAGSPRMAFLFLMVAVSVSLGTVPAPAQNLGSSGTVQGPVLDPLRQQSSKGRR